MSYNRSALSQDDVISWVGLRGEKWREEMVSEGGEVNSQMFAGVEKSMS